MTDATTNSAAPAANSGPGGPRRKVWRWLLTGLVAMLILLPAGAWWWASTEGSLRRALDLAAGFLPEDHRLQASGVRGSLAGGGRIDRLQWSKPGTALTIDDLRLSWSLRQLFAGALHVRTLQADSVHVRLTPQPDEPPSDPFIMPAQVLLPIEVTLPLAITRVQIESIDADGATSVQVFNDLAAHYRFDGAQHALRVDSLRYGESHLQAAAALHARELTLSADVAASLRNLVPDLPMAMLVHLRADGTLAGGEAARVRVRMDAREQGREAALPDPASLLTALANLRTTLETGTAAGTGAADAGAQLHAQASLYPWRTQPVQQAELLASRLNTHAFHALAPITRIGGRVSVRPLADAGSTAWNFDLQLDNDRPGAWDSQHLPLRRLTARGGFSEQLLRIDAAQADLAGNRPAGSLILAGQMPLAQVARSTVRLELRQLDLQPLQTDLPRTSFSGTASIDPLPSSDGSSLSAGRWQARADIRNALPGPWDRMRLPVDRLLADLQVTPERWRTETLQLQLGAGRLQLQGQFEPPTRAVEVRAELQRLPLQRIHGRMANAPAAALSGTLAVDGDLQQGLAFDADITSNVTDAAAGARRAQWEIRALQASGRWSPTLLSVERIHLDAFQAKVDGSDLEAVLPGLDSIKARVVASAPGLQLEADAAMRQQSGGGRLSLQLASAQQVMAWLRDLPVIGEQLPVLRATGAGSVQADWQGGWRQWAEGLRDPSRHPGLRLDAQVDAEALRVELPAAVQDQLPTLLHVDRLALQLQGNLAAARLQVDGEGRANDTRATLAVRMQMAEDGGAGPPLWNVTIGQFDVAATLPGQTQPWRLQVSEGLRLGLRTGAALELRATAGQATLSPPDGMAAGDEPLQVAWEPSRWSRGADGANTLQSRGTLRGIQPGWADVLLAARGGEGPLAGAGMRTDMLISGGWDIQMLERLDIRAHLQRDSGDVWLIEPSLGVSDAPVAAPAAGDVAAGIRTFRLQVQSEGEDIAAALDWDTQRAGVVTARLRTRLARRAGGWTLPPTAPLAGSIKAQLQDLGAWGFLAPPGWRVQGALNADIALDGSVQTPRLDGGIEVRGLNIRSLLDGIDLHDGVLRAKVQGERLEITELSLQGGTGSRAYVRGISGNRTPPPTERGRMTATGTIDWSQVGSDGAQGTGITMDLRANLQRMQVLVRNDRQVSLSGDLSAGLQQGALRVRGDLRVDRASIVLPEGGAPTLGDDVRVVRASDRASADGDQPVARGNLKTARPMDVEIKLDLGRDLALQGQGITTRLEGELTVRKLGSDDEPFRVIGEVRTVEGRYRAWGQALNVETGVVRFNGPYTNPSLELLAIRPEIEVRAGVRVTGTLMAPRVQLYSDPAMPEAEKLSWVVLGRATARSGAEGTSMQQAALGLLAGGVAGGLASGLGLDELGLSESSVAIGKRLSDELYVTYEAGLSGATSTLYLFYDITRRLTVRGQTGEATAVDLIYTITYD